MYTAKIEDVSTFMLIDDSEELEVTLGFYEEDGDEERKLEEKKIALPLETTEEKIGEIAKDYLEEFKRHQVIHARELRKHKKKTNAFKVMANMKGRKIS